MSRARRGGSGPTGQGTAGVEHLSAAEVAALRRALLAWFRATARDLPWRRTSDPYAIWVSEIMLQQTRVEAVTPYFERFMAEFPTVAALARAPQQQVLKLWSGLGYYSRARNLHRAAQAVMQEHGGELPASFEALQTLPGIGRYTAAAVASIAHGERAAVLDGNVKRVLARLFAVRETIDAGATTERLWALAAAILSPRAAGDFNQAVMELGATVCMPRGPRCLMCPVREHCQATRQGIAASLPVRTAKRPALAVQRACVLLRGAGGRLLVVRRPGRGLLGGMWEFPGVEIERLSLNDLAGIADRWRACYGISLRKIDRIGDVQHTFTHRQLTLRIFAARVRGAPSPKLEMHEESRWASRAEIAALPLANLERKVLALADQPPPTIAGSADSPIVTASAESGRQRRRPRRGRLEPQV